MDRDLERAKAGLDLIESQVHTTTNTRFQFPATAAQRNAEQVQVQSDARMVRIKKAVKTGNLCAAKRCRLTPLQRL
jgi:hypothetical protein